VKRPEAEEVNRKLSSKKQPAEFVAHCEYLSAWEEDKYTIAQATWAGREGPHRSRSFERAPGGQFRAEAAGGDRVHRRQPKQLVSVAASLIPFLENDDANRALMGSNMQRQAVPLLRADAPYVGTGMEMVTARDSGAVVLCKRPARWIRWIPSASSCAWRARPTKASFRARWARTSISSPSSSGRTRTRASTRSHREGGPAGAQGRGAGGRPVHGSGELALGRNVLVAFMPWRGYNFEDAILVSEKLVKEDYYTSIHIEEFESKRATPSWVRKRSRGTFPTSRTPSCATWTKAASYGSAPR